MAVHLLSGLTGTLSLDFNVLPLGGLSGGFLSCGGFGQFGAQLVACIFVRGLAASMTTTIGLAIHKTIGFRVTGEHEITGIDQTQHAETGYDFGGLGTRGRFAPHPETSSHQRSETSGTEIDQAKEGINA